jgi:outer membrane lipopolysaccharide assembly protein LptE/RlpB
VLFAQLKRLVPAILIALTLSSCGYHAVGRGNRLPSDVHTLAVPVFINQTQAYRVEQMLTRDVVREFIARTHYRVVNTQENSPDATLRGTVTAAQTAPLTYDAQTGRISSAVVTLNMKVTLVDRSGRVLFENPNYTFREQYQVSREITSFFEEETPALQRMSQDFARTLVSDILEAF